MRTHSTNKIGQQRSGLLVAALCFAVIVLDGYDLMIYGAIAPALLDYPAWDMTATEVGLIGSYTTFGMLIGALSVGALSDRLGRRRVFLAGTVWFSITTVFTAMAPSPELFGLFRFLSGVGLGGVMPTAIALTVEYAPRGKKQFYNAMMFVGYSVGGVVAALTALWFLSATGFRTMLWIGAAPALVLVPMIYFYMPESISYLRRHGRTTEANILAQKFGVGTEADSPAALPGNQQSAFRFLLGPRNFGTLTLFSIASFSGLMLVYGLNTWLPEIMRTAGYPLGSSLSFLLILNLGAVLGTVSAAALADKIGSKIAVSVSFIAAIVTLISLSFQPQTILLYVFIAIAGLGSIGTQILVNGYAAEYFPAWTRGTAVGITLGVGRVGAVVAPAMVGIIIDSQLGFGWNFYAFAIAAALGLIMVLLIPRTLRSSDKPASTQRGHEPLDIKST